MPAFVNRDPLLCTERRPICLLNHREKRRINTWRGTLIIVLIWCCFSELDSYLKPDKKRAEELRKEFQAGFDGIASRIWPNLRIIRGRTTGMVAKCHVFVFIRLKKKKWTPGCYESLLARHKQRTHPKALSLLSFHLLHFQILVANLTFKKWCDFKEICVCQCFFPPSLFRATRVVCKETARKIHRWCAYVLFFIHKFWIGHWCQFMAKRWADVSSCAVSRLFWIYTCWKLPWRTSQGKFSLDIMSRLISREVFLTPSLVDESRKPCHYCTGICKKRNKNCFSFLILFSAAHFIYFFSLIMRRIASQWKHFFLLFLTLHDHSQSWK